MRYKRIIVSTEVRTRWETSNTYTKLLIMYSMSEMCTYSTAQLFLERKLNPCRVIKYSFMFPAVKGKQHIATSVKLCHVMKRAQATMSAFTISMTREGWEI